VEKYLFLSLDSSIKESKFILFMCNTFRYFPLHAPGLCLLGLLPLSLFNTTQFITLISFSNNVFSNPYHDQS
jgi:hypothetical protein